MKQLTYLYLMKNTELTQDKISTGIRKITEEENLPSLNSSNNVQLYEIPISIIILLTVMYLCISLCAIFGNLMVFWIVLISKRMRNVTNLFIVNLALTDILIGSLVIPFQFQAALLQRWLLPGFMCSACPTVQVISLNVSIFTLTAIALDRHKAITKPLTNKLTKSKTKIIIILIWFFSLTLSIPTFLSWKIRYLPLLRDNLALTNSLSDNLYETFSLNTNENQTVNYANSFHSKTDSQNELSSNILLNDDNSNSNSNNNNININLNNAFNNLLTINLNNKLENSKLVQHEHQKLLYTNETIPFCDLSSIVISDEIRRIYNHILVSVQFFIPLFIISFAYIHMAIKLKSEDVSTNACNNIQRVLQVKRRIIKMLFIVVALFAICWAPYQMYNILQEIYPSINEYRYINIIWFTCHWLAMSNSCHNPFIYAIYSERFKSEFQNHFLIFCFWTKWCTKSNLHNNYTTNDCTTINRLFQERRNLS